MNVDIKGDHHIKISTILIILIVTLVLVNVVFFGSIIRKSFTNIVDIVQSKDFEIIYESVVYDGANLNFSVKKNTKNQDLTALKFIIENETSQYEYQQEVSSDFNILFFSINTLGKISRVLKLSVFPIYKEATLEEEEIGQGIVHFLDENQQQGIISYSSSGGGVGEAGTSSGTVPGGTNTTTISNQTPSTPQTPTSSTGKSFVGINLGPLSYYDTQWVFVDVMKSAGANGIWLTKNATGSSVWDTGYRLQIPLDSNGYPLEIPYNVPGVVTPQLVHIMIKGTGNYPSGDYIIFYDGDGDLGFDLSSQVISNSTALKKYIVRVSSPTTGGGFHMVIKRSNVNDPIRNIRIITPGFENTYQTQTFNPLFLQRIQGVGAVRFMDFQKTNNNPSTNTRTLKTYFTQSHPNGVALEYQIELANTLDADPWFNIPHLADDDYIRQFARTIKQNLESDKKVYVEYSNELWNSDFGQNGWIIQQGCNNPITKVTKADGTCDNIKSGFKYQAKRSAEIFKIFEEEFGVDSGRLVKVAGGKKDAGSVTGAYSNILMGYFNDASVNLYEDVGKPDVLAITTYFGQTISNPTLNQTYSPLTVSEILDKTEQHLIADSVDIGYNKQIANNYGVKLVAYEGGQHLVTAFEFRGDLILVNRLIQANRDPRMETLYNLMYQDWFNKGGDLLVNFNYAQKYDVSGSWGMLEYQDQPEADAPKYRAVKNAINTYKDGTTIQTPTSVCGNNIKEGSEACDDGNIVNGDGCSSLCTTEIPTGCTSNSQCNDNNVCTTDSCNTGVCSNTAITCNDNVVCTIDSCNPLSGCVYTATNNLCNDNNACTTDTCSATGCTNTIISGCGGGAPTAGLILQLDFENGFNDASGNGKVFSCTGTTCPILSIGPDGSKAYSFDGVDDGINSTSILLKNEPNGFAAGVWFKANSLVSGRIFERLFDNFEIYVSPNSIICRIRNSTGSYSVLIHSSINTNTWYHAVCNFDQSTKTLKIYLNGVNVKEQIFPTFDFFQHADNTAFGVGFRSQQFGGYFNGAIDDLRIYNKPLSDSEVQSLYNSYILLLLSPTQKKQNLFIEFFREIFS